MVKNIPVECLLNRTRNLEKEMWDGDLINGTLVDISTQSTEDNFGKLIPVGIVLLENNTFQCVPMEFIFAKQYL